MRIAYNYPQKRLTAVPARDKIVIHVSIKECDAMAGPGRGLGPRGFLTDEEKQNLPRVNGALLRRILGYLKPYWLQFLLVFVTILLSAVVGLLPSIITGRIVTKTSRNCSQ